MPEIPAHKIIAVTVTPESIGFPDFDIRNSDLKKWQSDLEEFLKKEYQPSTGTLNITINETTARIKWVPSKVNYEAEAYHKKALNYAKNRDLPNAIREWEQAKKLNNLDPFYHFNLGIIHFESKQFQSVIREVQETLEICPIYYKAHFLLGRSWVKIRKFNNAKENFSKGLKFEPKNERALLNLAATQSILRQYDQAIVTFQDLISVNPEEVRAYFGLAKLYSALGNIESANEYYRKVIELDKTGSLASTAKHSIVTKKSVKENSSINSLPSALDVDEQFSEGYRAFLRGDYSTSSTLYKNYLLKKPKDASTWLMLSSAYLRMGELYKAKEACRQAIKIEPNEGYYFKQLAIIYDYLGEPENSIEAIENARKLGKNDSTTLTILGKNLVLLAQHTKAIQILLQAINKNKNNLLAHYFLAAALAEGNNKSEASEHVDFIINFNEKTPLTEKAKKLKNQIEKTEKEQ